MSAAPEVGILWFDDIGRADVARVGGKGASLGELVRAGIRVPPGFVVGTEAFSNFMDSADPGFELRGEVARLAAGAIEATERVTRRVRERIAQSPVGAELESALARACDAIRGAAGFAVRSSATSEDSDEASFAGLQDTYLWVPAAEVADRVRACWASLYNPESVSYRRRFGLPEDGLAMGVVMQAMVDAESAGVMFSRSPTTGDKSVVTIEGSWGLGSSVVSGEVTPDKFIVNKVTGEIIHRAIADKAIRHRRDPGGSGVLVEEVAAGRREVACLSDEDLAALVALARRCEAHYGCPQDMEWAVAGGAEGKREIYMLQSRPETVWSQRETEAVSKPREKAFEHVFSVLGGPRK